MRKNRYVSAGIVVTLVHVAVIGGLVYSSSFGGCLNSKKPPEVVPFTVAIDPVGLPDPPEPEVKTPEPEKSEPEVKDDIPLPQPKPKPKPPEPKPKPKPPEPKPEPKPKPKPKPQMVKGTRVENKVKLPRPTFNPDEKQKLTAEELRKALDKGAVVGTKTSIPADEQSRNISILKREITNAWLRPSRENAGWRPAVVGFTLGAGGRISSPVLVTSSGNTVFDESVMAAVKSVDRVYGLSAQFIRSYPSIQLTFSFND